MLLSFIVLMTLCASVGSVASPTVINGGTIAVDTTWTPDASPYVIAGRLTIQPGATLTIQAGTVVKFDGRLESGIMCLGRLDATGSSEQPVYFTSIFDDTVCGDTDGDNGRVTPKAGTAGDLHAQGTGASLNLLCCRLRYGGKYGCGTICWADGGALVTIDGCEFSDSGGGVNCNACSTSVADSAFSNVSSALYLYGCANPSVSGCRFNGGYVGVILSATGSTSLSANTFQGTEQAVIVNDISGTIDVKGNSATGGSVNGILLDRCNVAGDSRLTSDPGLPYVVRSVTVGDGKTLTLDPGVVAKFDLNGGMSFYGTLKANGNAFAPIYFTSIRDDSVCGDTNGDGSQTVPSPGDWKCINLINQNSATMSYCVVKYGGQGSYSDNAAISLSSGCKLSATNCTITRNLRGVYSLGATYLSDAVDLINCIVADNTDYGCVVGGAGCKFDHNDFWPDTGNSYGTNPVMTANIQSNPLFANPQSGDLRLQGGSPCIDAGTGIDLDGTPTDMGAFPLMAGRVVSASSAKLRSRDNPSSIPFAVVKGVVSAVFGSYYYLQSTESMCGLRIYDPTSLPMTVGNVVIVSGPMGVSSYGERQMNGKSVVMGNGSIAPVFMACKSLGGGGFHYDPATGAGQEGIAGASGLNNIGLLVKTSGSFRWSSSTVFYVDDGSTSDVKCIVPSGVVLNPDWNYVSVTGVSSCERTSSGLQRVIRVRNQSDITSY